MTPADQKARWEARGRRQRLRRRMRGHTRLKRVGECGLAAFEEWVPVLRSPDGSASYSGIITCGSVSACPVCSARKRQRKAWEVEWRAKQWLTDGGGLMFVTLTVPHSMADDLEDLVDGELRAWRRIQQQSGFRAGLQSLGYVGPLRALEVTHGYNGWHPHLHLLLWFRRSLTAEEAVAVEGLLFDSWASACESEGLRRPSREHGIRSDRVGSTMRDAAAVGAYLVKLQDGYDAAGNGKWSAAHEMTRGDLKRGRSRHRSPFEIAERACDGHKGSLALWRRYEQVMHGRRVLQWGQKLYRVLKDEQTPPAVEPPQLVAELSRWEWNMLRAYHSDLALLAQVEVAGAEAVGDVLGSLFLRVRFDHARGRPPRASPESGSSGTDVGADAVA